ncbi:protein gone early-like [Ctenocephalides felis]|uniref:protein gone early-like n=1 Tax=Ctenocephalides felis TaxID=7515 RepID=UPI000E6E510D|nr:protein gone early-like [Ctenocephalides felis]
MRDVATMLGATSTDASQFSDDVYYYERRLAETAASLGDIDADTKYEIVTLQQLQSAAPQLPVYDVITSMFPRAKIKLNTQILVPSLKYTRRLSELISTSDRAPINNYMMWTLTLTYLPYLNSAYRLAYRDFQQSLITPAPFKLDPASKSSSSQRRSYPTTTEPPPPRWYECAKVVRDWAGPILENQEMVVESSIGVDLDKSEPSRGKERARWIFAKMRDAVIDAVLKSVEISGERQREAVRKLKTTTLQIGAPAETHVNTYRERFYRDFSVLRNAFFENALAASEQKRAIMENSLIPPSTGTQGAHDSAVSMLEFMVKMPLSVRFYEPQRVVTLPLALLQLPHFHIDHPVSLQVARLGVPIGEALFASVFNIVADNDTDVFLQCFSRHVPIETGRRGIALKTASIHLSAVRAAASALHKIQSQAEYDSESVENDNVYDLNNNNRARNSERQRKEFQHGLGDMNSKQLFTLAYAQTMCSKSTPEMEQLSPLIRGKLSDHDLFLLSWTRVKDLRKSVGCKLSEYDSCPSSL